MHDSKTPLNGATSKQSGLQKRVLEEVDEKRDEIEGVISVDGSCRPQIISAAGSRYGKLLQEVKQLTDTGVLLNTSFNIHGEPLVCSPQNALNTLRKTGNEYLVMGNYLITLKA